MPQSRTAGFPNTAPTCKEELEQGIELASEELIGIVEATSASRCEAEESCRADFFLYAAEAGGLKANSTKPRKQRLNTKGTK